MSVVLEHIINNARDLRTQGVSMIGRCKKCYKVTIAFSISRTLKPNDSKHHKVQVNTNISKKTHFLSEKNIMSEFIEIESCKFLECVLGVKV